MSSSKTIIALHNYGGGMRGLIPAHFMARIEQVTGLPMSKTVDIFTGPSTGSILNAALNVPCPHNPQQPRFEAQHMVKFYEREGIKIFPPDRFRDFRGLIHDFNNRTMKISKLKALFAHGHYNPYHLAQCLKALYGDVQLSQTLSSLIIPVYNLDGEQLNVVEEADETDDAPVHTQNNITDQGGYAVWLKNIYFRKNHQKTPDVSLYDAVMASTAAPTYFPCHHFEVGYKDDRGQRTYSGIDGSIFDNPCIGYHGAIRQHMPDDTRVIMLALGTGDAHRSYKGDDWNNFGGLGVVDPVNDLPLINILFHAPESALIESFRQELGDDFFLFNKSLVSDKKDGRLPSTEIDDASPENLKKLKWFFEETLEDNKEQFEEVCHLLVNNRDQNEAEEHETKKKSKKNFFFWQKSS